MLHPLVMRLVIFSLQVLGGIEYHNNQCVAGASEESPQVYA